MSYTIQCPDCKAEWIPLDKVSPEFKFNLLKAENARLREALKAIYEDDWVEGTKVHGPFIGQTLEEISRAALEGKE